MTVRPQHQDTPFPPSEREIVHAILSALGSLPGVRIHRNNIGVATHASSSGRMLRTAYGVGGVGAPDLLCEVRLHPHAGPWLAVWLEVKTTNGRLSPAQQQWHAAARALGRHLYVVHSVEEALAAVEDAARAAGGPR